MVILLYILIGLFSIIALIFLIAIFSKKDYAIQRSITINKPSSEVFEYIKFLKNQEQYSKWVMTDPSMKTEFTGTDGSIGFIYAWDSTNKQAGAGEQEIIDLIDGKMVDVEVRFIRPFKGIAKTQLTLETLTDNQTKVIWSMSSRMNYPMNIMLLLMNIDKMLGKDLEISLNNLKEILEKK